MAKKLCGVSLDKKFSVSPFFFAGNTSTIIARRLLFLISGVSQLIDVQISLCVFAAVINEIWNLFLTIPAKINDTSWISAVN